MTGTSTRTPTTAASAPPDWKPNSAIAIATASSKKLLAPMRNDHQPDRHGDRQIHLRDRRHANCAEHNWHRLAKDNSCDNAKCDPKRQKPLEYAHCRRFAISGLLVTIEASLIIVRSFSAKASGWLGHMTRQFQ